MEKLTIRLRGNFACWADPNSRPHYHSYKIPTESALKGIVDNIYYHPENENFDLVFDKIIFIKKPQDYRLSFNGKESGRKNAGIANITYHILADIDFAVSFYLRKKRALSTDEMKLMCKYHNSIKNRIEKNRSFYRLYFGKNEYPATYELVENIDEITPIDWTEDFGCMFWKYIHDGHYKTSKVKGVSIWTNARIDKGVVIVPNDEQLREFCY